MLALGEPNKFVPYKAPHRPPLFGVPVRTVIEPLAAEETSLGWLYGFEPMENSCHLVDHIGTDHKDLDRVTHAPKAHLGEMDHPAKSAFDELSYVYPKGPTFPADPQAGGRYRLRGRPRQRVQGARGEGGHFGARGGRLVTHWCGGGRSLGYAPHSSVNQEPCDLTKVSNPTLVLAAATLDAWPGPRTA